MLQLRRWAGIGNSLWFVVAGAFREESFFCIWYDIHNLETFYQGATFWLRSEINRAKVNRQFELKKNSGYRAITIFALLLSF
jgi:hypothetical protein